jgi:hypothetical protein
MTAEEDWAPPASAAIDTTIPHPARRYDYWLGGKDNFAADRESGDAVVAAFPTIRLWAVENRRFLRRAVTFLAREAGIRQFLDIGTGIPTANNTHEVAQSIAPESRIVYVDNDPIVLVHARALLTSSPAGKAAYLEADFREPEAILAHPSLRDTLDLSQPVGLMLIALLHFMKDEDNPFEHVATLVDAMPSGSYLTLTHAVNDHLPPRKAGELNDIGRVPFEMRPRTEVARFFDGLELVPPGLVSLSEWRAEDEPQPRPSVVDIAADGAVARIS